MLLLILLLFIYTIINGYQLVKDGYYSVIYDSIKNQYKYYKRIKNKWLFDQSRDELVSKDNNLLCNLQDNCIQINTKYSNKCESIVTNKSELMTNAYNEMLNQFDKNYDISTKKLMKQVDEQYSYYFAITDKIKKIYDFEFLKYNNQKIAIGLSLQNETFNIILSPFIPLRDSILGLTDFTKKQNDIIRFTIKYTREAFSNQENIHWRYCIQTNTKLLPSFLYLLAVSFIKDPDTYLHNVPN
jgi:hypothetical protein